MPGINLEKLAELREAHAELLDSYRAATRRARELAGERTQLAMAALADADTDKGPAILARAAEALAATPDGELAAARLNVRAVRRVVAADGAMRKQQAAAAALALRVRASAALMQRIEEFAARHE